MRCQAVDVVVEEFIFALGIGTVQVAGRSAFLVRTQQQATGLFAHVPGAVGFAKHAQFGQALLMPGKDVRVRLGDDVLVLYGQHGDIQTDHGAGAAREVARCRHDVFGDPVTLVGAHEPFAAARLLDADDAGLALDRSTPEAGAASQRLREIGRLYVAIVGMANGADESIGDRQRPDVVYLVGRQELDTDADGARDASVLAVLVHAVWRHRETNVAHGAQAHVRVGLLFQPAVEIDRVLVDLPDGVTHVEQRQEARGVPRGTRCQFLALEQHHVRPALGCEVVESGDSDDTAADDHHPGMLRHLPIPLRLRCAEPAPHLCPRRAVDIWGAAALDAVGLPH